MELVGGEEYQRAPAVDCKPRTFNAGAQVTVVSYMGSSAYKNFASQLPGYPHHFYFYVAYASPVPGSHYTAQAGSIDADAVDAAFSLRDNLRLFVGLQTPSAPDGPLEQVLTYPFVKLLLAGVWLFKIVDAPDINPFALDGDPAMFPAMVGDFFTVTFLIITVALVVFLTLWRAKVGVHSSHRRHSCCFAVSAFFLFLVTALATIAFVLRTFLFPLRAYGGDQYDNKLLQEMYYPTNALLWDTVGVIIMTVATVLTFGCCFKTLHLEPPKSNGPPSKDKVLL